VVTSLQGNTTLTRTEEGIYVKVAEHDSCLLAFTGSGS
jgi:hypothetical protein